MNNKSELLIWQDAWLLGIDYLDQDHRTMVHLINALIDESDRNESSIRQRVSALREHLNQHFAAEEDFLRRIDYPGFCAHKQEHLLELSEINALTCSLERQAQQAIDIAIFKEIKHWFLNHAVLEDRRFADYFFQQLEGSLDIDIPLPAEPDCAQSG